MYFQISDYLGYCRPGAVELSLTAGNECRMYVEEEKKIQFHIGTQFGGLAMCADLRCVRACVCVCVCARARACVFAYFS